MQASKKPTSSLNMTEDQNVAIREEGASILHMLVSHPNADNARMLMTPSPDLCTEHYHDHRPLENDQAMFGQDHL